MASEDRFGQALTYINKAQGIGGFGENFIAGMSGLVLSAFAIAIGLGQSFANLIQEPVDAFAWVSALSVRAIFGGPAEFLQSMWNTAAVSLGMDPWMQLGPFIVFVGSSAAVLGILPILWFLDREDSDTLTGLDLPFLDLDRGGDESDESG